MVAQVQTHETSIALVQADLGKCYAGMDMVLQVQVSCAPACDLLGKTVRIVDQDGAVVQEAALAASDETAYYTDELVVQSPTEPGEYIWTAVFPEQAHDEGLYRESSMPFSFIVVPHATSMAVWDVTSPVIVGADFTVKVGVKCATGCSLANENIEIYDHEGASVATGTLGDVPYSNTDDLYWAEVALTAPAAKGTYTWEVKLPRPGLELPHEGTSFKFGFSAAREPKHAVTIEVVNQETKAPVANAHVMLRPYSGHTDGKGVVKLKAAEGEYILYVAKDEYETYRATVEVAGDTTIQAELLPALFVEDYRGNLSKVERRRARSGR